MKMYLKNINYNGENVLLEKNQKNILIMGLMK